MSSSSSRISSPALDLDELESRAKWERVLRVALLVSPIIAGVAVAVGTIVAVVIVTMLPPSMPGWVTSAVIWGFMLMGFGPVVAFIAAVRRGRTRRLAAALTALIGEANVAQRGRIAWSVYGAALATGGTLVAFWFTPLYANAPSYLQSMASGVVASLAMVFWYALAMRLRFDAEVRERVNRDARRAMPVLLVWPAVQLGEVAEYLAWDMHPVGGVLFGPLFPLFLLVPFFGAMRWMMTPRRVALEAVKTGDWAAALELARTSPGRVAHHVELEALIAGGQYAEAEQHALSEARFLNGNAMELILDRHAEARLRQGAPEEAERRWLAVLSAYPNSGPALVGVVRSRIARGIAGDDELELLELALERFERSLPRAPRERSAEAHACRAVVLGRLGQTRDAEQAEARARSLTAEDATPAWTAALVNELLDA